MEIFRLPLLVFLFLGFGYSYVMFLTVHPLKMSRFLLIAVSTFTTGIIMLITNFQGNALVIGSTLALVSVMGAFITTTRHVLSREDPHPVPHLSRRKEDAGDGHTAVIYFTHGEPETYDPIGWINQFREFDEQKIPFVPIAARPYFLHSLRKKYLVVGRSEHHWVRT